MSALILPRIGAGVPRAMVPPDDTARCSRIVDYLFDAGMFAGTVFPHQWDSPLLACQSALRRWVADNLGRMRHLRPAFFIQCADEHAEGEGVVLTWWAHDFKQWCVGEGIAALESAVPGLGQATYRALALQRSYPLYGPDDAVETASYLCWNGEDDETEAMLEYSEGQEREDQLAAIVTRAEIDAAYPSYILLETFFAAPRRGMASRRLRELARNGGSIGRIAELVLQLRALDDRLRLRAEAASRDGTAADRDDAGDHGEFWGYGGMLRWAEGDVTEQLFEMNENWVQQDSCHDWTDRCFCAFDKPAQLRERRAQMLLHLQIMRRLDDLIERLAGR